MLALRLEYAIILIILHTTCKAGIVPMKFWKSFSKKAVLRQFFFVLALFALLIPVAIWDSGTQVKVKFYAEDFRIKSDRYTMTVRYDQVAEAELTALIDPGEKVEDGFDNDIVRTGTWRNDAWGVYSINADPDTTLCVKMILTDGRVFVFSSKDDVQTEDLYKTLMTHVRDA